MLQTICRKRTVGEAARLASKCQHSCHCKAAIHDFVVDFTQWLGCLERFFSARFSPATYWCMFGDWFDFILDYLILYDVKHFFWRNPMNTLLKAISVAGCPSLVMFGMFNHFHSCCFVYEHVPRQVLCLGGE